MKKNIFGMILFSFIVGTAIFISFSRINLPSPPAVEETETFKDIVYESRSRCGKRGNQAPARVRLIQTVLNQKTNQLNTTLEIVRRNSSTENFNLRFHFFVKNGSETRYLESEDFFVQPNFNSVNKAALEKISSYDWLETLNSKDNLYLIVETINDRFSKDQTIPRFDEFNASPVLIMKSKN